MPTASSRRRPPELASSSTDGSSSPKLTPSPRSSHSTNESGSYELQPIRPRDQPVSKDDSQEEEDGLLPSLHRASLDSVQSFELYTPDEDRAILKKLDRKLVAFMAFLYSLSFLDRSSKSSSESRLELNENSVMKTKNAPKNYRATQN